MSPVDFVHIRTHYPVKMASYPSGTECDSVPPITQQNGGDIGGAS